MIAALIPLLARLGVAERFQRAAAWLAALIGAIVLAALCWALVAWLIGRHDQGVTARHDQAREAAGAAGRERSAEEAVADAFQNQRLRDQRDAAIAQAAATEAAKPPEARATTAPQEVTLNCAIAREDYTAAELAKMPEYQEHCR